MGQVKTIKPKTAFDGLRMTQTKTNKGEYKLRVRSV
jgi:hypothetical protein